MWGCECGCGNVRVRVWVWECEGVHSSVAKEACYWLKCVLKTG